MNSQKLVVLVISVLALGSAILYGIDYFAKEIGEVVAADTTIPSGAVEDDVVIDTKLVIIPPTTSATIRTSPLESTTYFCEPEGWDLLRHIKDLQHQLTEEINQLKYNADKDRNCINELETRVSELEYKLNNGNGKGKFHYCGKGGGK